ncbi:MAG: nuclear transport factor 2 family protein [Acidobacteria bacterium]|nr:nuclear transport factor 2 family protein [Acidobacteriota bacterium]
MNKLVVISILLLACAIPFHAQTAKDAPVLTKMLNDFLAGVNDPAVHDRFWADDLIYTRSAGVRITKVELMKGMRSSATPKTGDPVVSYFAEDIQIHQYGKTAVVAFKLVSTTTRADGTKTVGNNLNTGVFVKRKGRWQVVAWQSTTVPLPKN